MIPSRLPATIGTLRDALLRGRLSVSEALRAQREALLADPYHCVAGWLDTDGDAPPLALPLAGVGLAHKDIFTLRGYIPCCGASAPWARAPRQTAIAVERLQQAGATQSCTLTMAEYACGATGENIHYALPLNPVDAQAAVGGSSSGSAIAVAAGLVYGSLCTDTAGSVRIPAATCGVMGLKPGNDLLPARGVAPLAATLDTVGLIARSADDLECLLTQAMTPAQRHDHDRHHHTVRGKAWGDWSVAVCWHHPDPSVQSSDALLEELETLAQACSQKAHMTPVSLAGLLPELIRLAQTILYVEASTLHMDALTGDADRNLSRLTRMVALSGAVVPATWYRQALTKRDECLARFLNEVLSDHDLLLTPCLPAGVPDWQDVLTSSPSFKPRALVDLFAWTSFVNYLGLPAIVLPVSCDGRGRPVALHAVAAPGKEAWLIEFARQVESHHFDGRQLRRPPT